MADPKKDITPEEGRTITQEAAKWEGTPYDEVGAGSQQGVSADCSGSTYRIYTAAHFPYDYRNTATFKDYVTQSGLFRKLASTEQPQDGDLLLWSSHMAIYSTFTGDAAHATTARTSKSGHPFVQTNDAWSATHKGGNPYGPGKISYLRGGVMPDVYRYQK